MLRRVFDRILNLGDFPDGLVVKTLCFQPQVEGIWSLVGELRSHIWDVLYLSAKKNSEFKKKKKATKDIIDIIKNVNINYILNAIIN